MNSYSSFEKEIYGSYNNHSLKICQNGKTQEKPSNLQLHSKLVSSHLNNEKGRQKEEYEVEKYW